MGAGDLRPRYREPRLTMNASWIRRNRYYLLLAGAFVIAGALAVLFVLPGWFWHPIGTQACKATYHTAAQVRDCLGYNYHSGIGSDLSEVTLLVGIAVFWLKHNCYEHGCPLIGRVKGDDGHLRCKRHHKRGHPAYAQPNPAVDRA